MKTLSHALNRVLLLFGHNNIADRERLAGVLSYAATRSDWDIRILDRSSASYASDYLQTTKEWQPDAIICVATGDYRKALPVWSSPQVFKIKLEPPEGDDDSDADVAVRIDAQALATAVIDHFTERQYHHFAYYGTKAPEEAAYSSLGERHFKSVLRKRRIDCSCFAEATDASLSERLEQATVWLNALPKPCAIWAYSDVLAHHLIDACRSAKLSVPEQIGIVGIDNDISLCELSRPTLSSVEPDFKGCGFIAAQALQRLFEKGRRACSHCRKLRFGVAQLAERTSSRDLTGRQRIASAIERLIRETPLDELNFKKIVDTLHASRRLLEIHYRNVFGRTIHQDIVKRRLLAIRKLLQTTRLPIGQIVEQCGYNTVNAAQVAYRHQFNEPMSAARNGKKDVR